MPTYLDWFEVDWSWNDLREDERLIVRRYHAILQSDPRSQSDTSLAELLAKASLELPGRSIYARGEDDNGELTLIARDGQRGDADEADFDPDGGVPDAPTGADYRAAGVEKVCKELYFDESMLDEITNEATRQDKSLSWMVQKAWRLAAAEVRKLPARERIADGETA